ncbi:MAG TPA: glycoside hydrolase family 16 protein [Mucilaginibacter sp.]|jgi:beta-glucanase (GH16 family)|nr:glycoside hydrolase family 16 protein [Mucilaginibacter sp.]
MFRKFISPIILLLPAITLFETCSKSNGNLDNKNQPPVVVTDTTKKTDPIYSLVWSDEFDGPNIDDAKWNFETGGGGWGNAEQEYYQPDNATISNGNLVITVKKESVGGESYTSSRMTTQNKFSQTYGRVEARIKLPVGVGMWPAFWMLGNNIGTVNWPTCGEIDIMEHINTDSLIHGSLHWNGGNTSQQLTSSPSDYHIYAVEWDSSEVRFYVDSTRYDTEPVASISAFHLPFFLILNVAAGGNWPGQTIDQSILPASMYIDYVRVYKQTN